MPPPNSIELRDVTKRFGDSVVAVDRVDLAIRAGEFLTLLGPSGCGKTTILRMISGFETPTEGAVLLEGRDVTHLPPYRRDVNQVFQSYALFPHLSVRENIAFGLRMKRLGRAEIAQRVAEAIELVSLAGLESRKPSQLSGGQKQRVALARAIVNRPKVLLLDEPLAALDAKLRRAMQIELKRLQHRLRITFVFVTHDQEEALTMSDRIALMNAGRIEQIGTVAEIYHRPATRFVAGFVGHANLLRAEVIGSEHEHIRVKIGGTIEFRVAKTQAAGDVPGTLTLSVRPEKIAVSSERPTDSGCFEATVIEELFRGPLDQLLLRTSVGLELTALVANQGATQQPIHAGDRVWCSIHPDDVILVHDEPPAQK